MEKSIEKLIEIIETLETDFKIMDKNNTQSIEMMKDRALLLLPVINISKENPLNSKHSQTYDDLLSRVALIVSNLS